MNIPSTARRVPDSTAASVNERIRQRTRCSLSQYASASPVEIERRLRELDEEWDIERTLEANASIAMLSSIALGATVDRRWFGLTAVVSGFLLMHAVQGWCPPMPILRRLGFRTSYEIDEERYALKALRGDFAGVGATGYGDPEIEALERFEDEGGLAYEEPPVTHREVIEELIVAVRG